MKTQLPIILVILALLLASMLVGCGKGFAKGDLTTSPTTDTTEPSAKQPYGEWFCPDSLVGLTLSEDGGCTLTKMSSPTSQKEESHGSYTIEDGRLTIALPTETLEYDMIFNGNKMLILTDSDGAKYTFTPAE